MFQNIGLPEVAIVLGIVLLIFGPKRLPAAGRALGHSMREFKDSISGRNKDDAELEQGDASAEATPEPAAPAKASESASGDQRPSDGS